MTAKRATKKAAGRAKGAGAAKTNRPAAKPAVLKKAVKAAPAKATPAKKSARKTVAAQKPSRSPRRAVAADKPAGASRTAHAARSAKVAKGRTPRELEHYRRLLLDKRQELITAYQNAQGERRARQDEGTEDYIDYAVSSYDREFMLSLSELERKQIRLVEEALGRIERREGYGRCAQCDKEIPGKRLEVQSWARYCVQCQELEEQGLLMQEAGEVDFGEDEPDSTVELQVVEEEEPELVIEEDVDTDDAEDDEGLDDDRLLNG
jgi:DnaK suppressor protein